MGQDAEGARGGRCEQETDAVTLMGLFMCSILSLSLSALLNWAQR